MKTARFWVVKTELPIRWIMNKLQACHKIVIPSFLTVDRALDSQRPIFHPTGDTHLHHWMFNENVVSTCSQRGALSSGQIRAQTMGPGCCWRCVLRTNKKAWTKVWRSAECGGNWEYRSRHMSGQHSSKQAVQHNASHVKDNALCGWCGLY